MAGQAASGSPPVRRLGRLVQSADFERLRAAPSWSRSAHFAVQHLPWPPGRPGPARKAAASEELSTGPGEQAVQPVDQSVGLSADQSAAGHWLGTVLPKRLAKRSVTRNLLRRQIREAMTRHLPALPPGLWVVRLRSPFVRSVFVSAASDALRQAAALELDQLLRPRKR